LQQYLNNPKILKLSLFLLNKHEYCLFWCRGWDPHPNLPVKYCFGYRK
jgi:hypothetical protein